MFFYSINLIKFCAFLSNNLCICSINQVLFAKSYHLKIIIEVSFILFNKSYHITQILTIYGIFAVVSLI
jgi:hypothetical protein